MWNFYSGIIYLKNMCRFISFSERFKKKNNNKFQYIFLKKNFFDFWVIFGLKEIKHYKYFISLLSFTQIYVQHFKYYPYTIYRYYTVLCIVGRSEKRIKCGNILSWWSSTTIYILYSIQSKYNNILLLCFDYDARHHLVWIMFRRYVYNIVYRNI